MDNITTIIISLTSMITALVALFVKVANAKDQIQDILPRKIKKQSDVDIEVIGRLEEVKEFLNADRVQIYDFHNGRTLCKWKKCFKNFLYL